MISGAKLEAFHVQIAIWTKEFQIYFPYTYHWRYKGDFDETF